MHTHTNRTHTRGFTLLETLIAIAILTILAVVLVVGVSDYAAHQSFKTTVTDVRDGIIEMRQRTLASSNDMLYGVHVSSTAVTLFEGGTFTSGAAGNTVITLPGSITATTSLTSGVPSATFTRIAGVPSATGTILLTDSSSDAAATITISASGRIE